MYFKLIFAFILSLSSSSTYQGYKVFRIKPSNDHHLKLLANFSHNEHFDFWSPIRDLEKPIDVMVDSHTDREFSKVLNDSGVTYEIIIDDVQTVLQTNEEKQSIHPRMLPRKDDYIFSFDYGQFRFKHYNSHQDINNYLDELAQTHANTVSVETIGKSYEKRSLNVIKISTDPSANKPIIFIDAGIHAREWIAPAQALYIIHQLVEEKENAFLLEKVDWHILPMINPDGYEYTHSGLKHQLWRKTTSHGNRCAGTDGNRNFAFHWGEIGASVNECTNTYMGSKPFSESETLALRDYILRHKENIKLYLSLHSYGNYILFPWGYTSALPDNYDELKALGDMVANTIHTVNGVTYTVGTSTNALSPGAGGSDDWAKGVAGIDLAYTIELPGGGNHGFNPPASEILNIVSETWSGIKAFHHYIKEKYGRKKKYNQFY